MPLVYFPFQPIRELFLPLKLKTIALRKAGTARAVLMIMLGFKLEYTMAVLKQKFAEVEKDGTERIDQLPLAREMGFVKSLLIQCSRVVL